MHNRQKQRKETLDKIKIVINDNPNLSKKELIAIICYNWGFSERIINEYYDILENAGQINRRTDKSEPQKLQTN